MSDIFVSYDDLDRPRVHELVAALEARGWSVWWDHRIATGDSFSQVIERELNAALCVIVVWTGTSIDSEWVRAEANEAWKRGKLIPVLLDRVTPPMPFGQIQAADLVDWDDHGHPGFAKLAADLQRRIGRAAVAPAAAPPPPAGWSRKRGLAAIGAVAVLLAIAGAAYLSSLGRGAGATSVTPAADSAASAGLAGAVVESDRGSVAAALRGHWEAPVTYPDGATFVERFTFDVTDLELSGTASLRGYGNRRGIMDGTVDGDRVSFRTTGRVQLDLFSVREVAYLYRGTLEGDSIRFTVVEEGSGDPAFAFTSHRISAEQASRIATGGTRPRLGGMSTNGLYRPDHIRAALESGQGAMAACYQAAEYDEVAHEFVSYNLTLSARGTLEQVEMVPEIASLESCMRAVFAATGWGPTDSGEGGTLQLSVTARLPWNP